MLLINETAVIRQLFFLRETFLLQREISLPLILINGVGGVEEMDNQEMVYL